MARVCAVVIVAVAASGAQAADRIDNPAYNADRGPAHVFTGRFHAEF
jgi:hypothetical protein